MFSTIINRSAINILKLIGSKRNLNIHQLSKATGIINQRIISMTRSWAHCGLITREQVGREMVIEFTEYGKEQMNRLMEIVDLHNKQLRKGVKNGQDRKTDRVQRPEEGNDSHSYRNQRGSNGRKNNRPSDNNKPGNLQRSGNQEDNPKIESNKNSVGTEDKSIEENRKGTTSDDTRDEGIRKEDKINK